jgi:hypothetical protein
MVEARRNEERQGVVPVPADPQLLARLRLDACDSTSLMVEQYKVPFHPAQCQKFQGYVCLLRIIPVQGLHSNSMWCMIAGLQGADESRCM